MKNDVPALVTRC